LKCIAKIPQEAQYFYLFYVSFRKGFFAEDYIAIDQRDGMLLDYEYKTLRERGRIKNRR